MKIILTVLLVAVMAAEAVIWFQMYRRIKSWEKEVEKEDQVLTDEEQRCIQVRATILQILSIITVVLMVLRFVVCDLLPLIRG